MSHTESTDPRPRLYSTEVEAQNARFGFNQPQYGTTLNHDEPDRTPAEEKTRATVESVLMFVLFVAVMYLAAFCGQGGS